MRTRLVFFIIILHVSYLSSYEYGVTVELLTVRLVNVKKKLSRVFFLEASYADTCHAFIVETNGENFVCVNVTLIIFLE